MPKSKSTKKSNTTKHKISAKTRDKTKVVESFDITSEEEESELDRIPTLFVDDTVREDSLRKSASLTPHTSSPPPHKTFSKKSSHAPQLKQTATTATTLIIPIDQKNQGKLKPKSSRSSSSQPLGLRYSTGSSMEHPNQKSQGDELTKLKNYDTQKTLKLRMTRAHSVAHSSPTKNVRNDSPNPDSVDLTPHPRKQRHQSELPEFFSNPWNTLEETLQKNIINPISVLHHKFSDGHGKWIPPKHLRKDNFEIVSFSEATPYQSTNQYITEGYRTFFSPWNAIKSVFRWHNETLNIWTHALAIPLFLYFAYIIIYHPVVFGQTGVPGELTQESKKHFWWSYSVLNYQALRATKYFGDSTFLSTMETPWTFPSLSDHLLDGHVWVFAIYFFGSISCFAFSSFFHTMCCVSEKVNNVCLKCDLTGIVLLIGVSFVPPVVYMFDCDPPSIHLYLTMIAISGVLVWCLLCLPVQHYIAKWKFGVDPTTAPEPVLMKIKKFNKMIRTISLCSLALSGAVPVAHVSAILPPDMILISQFRLIGTILCYGVGIIFYLSGFPERMWPGKFNFILSSHQIWHIAVIIGALFHLDSSLFFYHQWIIHRSEPDYCSHFHIHLPEMPEFVETFWGQIVSFGK